MTDWSYYFHGQGCCVRHAVSGVAIAVDFYEGTTEWIDSTFFLWFLESLKSPSFIEQQRIALHPTLETLLLSFDELVEADILFRRGRSNAVRLSDEFRGWGAQVDDLDASDADVEPK